MTTYSYTLVLNDSECITLEAALDLLLDKCQKELIDGPCAPFYAWQSNISSIRRKINDGVELTSTNNFS